MIENLSIWRQISVTEDSPPRPSLRLREISVAGVKITIGAAGSAVGFYRLLRPLELLGY